MRLLIDGVEIPWPRKIEIQVDKAGETAGPLYVELSGGQLTIQGNAERPNGLALIHNQWGWEKFGQPFIRLFGHGQPFGPGVYVQGPTAEEYHRHLGAELPQPDAVQEG